MQGKTAKAINQKNIGSVQQSLKLLKCQISRQILEMNKSCCRGLNQLSKMLKMKNEQTLFRTNKLISQKRGNIDGGVTTFCLGLQQHSIKSKIIEEMQIAKIRISEVPAQIQQNTQNSFTHLMRRQTCKQTNKNELPNIYDHLNVRGLNQAYKIASIIQINNESSAESMEDLVEAFNQMLFLEQPINLFTSQPSVNVIKGGIEKQKLLLNFMLQLKQGNSYKMPCIIQILNQSLSQIGRHENILKKRTLFNNLLKLLKRYTEISPFNIKKRTIRHIANLHQEAVLLTDDWGSQQKFKAQLRDQQFWQKICFLFHKNNKYDQLLSIHLKQYGQQELNLYYQTIIAGENKQFEPKLNLMEQNKYYREFVLLLERKYLKFCINSKDKDGRNQEELVYFALKQIQLSRKCNQSYNQQLLFLQKQQEKYLKQLKLCVIAIKKQQSLLKAINKLLLLGQFTSTFYTLRCYQKISQLEYTILLAALCQLDTVPLSNELYSKEKTVKKLNTIIFQTVTSTTTGNWESIYNYLTAFVPILNQQISDVQTNTIDILTHSQTLFPNVMENKRFLQIKANFGIQFGDIEKLINKYTLKHTKLSFCLQLTLSSCINLFDFDINQIQTAQSKYQKLVRETKPSCFFTKSNRDPYCEFINTTISILDGMSPEQKDDKANQRLNLLYAGFTIMMKANLQMIKKCKLNKRQLDQIVFLNNLYRKLKSDQSKQLIWHNFGQQITNQQKKMANQTINGLVLAVNFSYDMLLLKLGIQTRDFQSIIFTLNHFYQEISEKQSNLLQVLEKTYSKFEISQFMILYLGRAAQSIQFLKESKPKVFNKNRNILQPICHELLSFVRICKEHCNSTFELITIRVQKILKGIYI